MNQAAAFILAMACGAVAGAALDAFAIILRSWATSAAKMYTAREIIVLGTICVGLAMFAAAGYWLALLTTDLPSQAWLFGVSAAVSCLGTLAVHLATGGRAGSAPLRADDPGAAKAPIYEGTPGPAT